MKLDDTSDLSHNVVGPWREGSIFSELYADSFLASYGDTQAQSEIIELTT